MACVGEVKLLGSGTSPYVTRPRVALNLKRVEYEFLPQAFVSKRELVQQYNPVYKKIPVYKRERSNAQRASSFGEMAGGDEVKVLGSWASPFVMRPRIALNLKGVGYEFLQEPFGSKSELLLKSNPVYKKAPVLIHDGKPVAESMIIVQYIDEVWPDSGPAILPSDPYDLATARFWTVYFDDKWFDSLKAVAIVAEREEAKAEAAEYVLAVLQQLEAAFESCSKGKCFFGGDTIGYLDIAVGSHLGWLKAAQKMTGIKFLDKGKTPLLVGWTERFCSDAAVKELMPEVDKLIEFAHLLQAKLKAAAAAKK